MSCTNLKEYETPYNSNPEVLARTGIMFDVMSKSRTITISTIEMDVQVGLGNPLNVDIYVTDSPVNQVYSQESSWSLVAQTKFVEDPLAESAIVPSWHFSPVTVEGGKTKGFYIRMKGNYVDNTVSPDIAAGIEAANGEDLVVYAGYYVDQNSERFPSTVSSDQAPIFAGKFHYEVFESCAARTRVISELEFALIVDTALAATDLASIESATYAIVSQLFDSDAVLKNYVSQDALSISADGVTTEKRAYAGNCPNEWIMCDAIVTTVKFEHNKDRRGGDIKESLYQYYQQISEEQLKTLQEGTRAAYVGLVDSLAFFRLTLDGVTDKAEMDSEQITFLEDQVTEFLNSKMPVEREQAFTVNITDQLLLGFDSIQVEGSITGGIIASDSNADFTNRIENVFYQFENDFFTLLKYHLNFPGPMAQDERYMFFDDASNLTFIAEVNIVTSPPTSSPTVEVEPVLTLSLNPTGAIDPGIIIGVGVGGGIILGLTILYFCYRRIMKQRKREAEKNERREEYDRMKAIKRGESDPALAPKETSVEEGKGEAGKTVGRKNSSRRGLLARARGNESMSGSDRFKDEASSTSSEEYHESTLLAGRSRGSAPEEFIAHLGQRQASRKSSDAFDNELGDDDDVSNLSPNQEFDPFNGNSETDNPPSQVGPKSTGFDPIAGDERSYDDPDQDSNLFSAYGPNSEEDEGKRPTGRRRSTGREKSKSRRRSSSGTGQTVDTPVTSKRDAMAETVPHASSRALNKVRDLEMQALYESGANLDQHNDDGKDSSGNSQRSTGDLESDHQQSFTKTKSSRSLESGSSHKKKTKKKSKSKEGTDDEDQSLSRRRRKKLEESPDDLEDLKDQV